MVLSKRTNKVLSEEQTDEILSKQADGVDGILNRRRTEQTAERMQA